ncbi:MAG: hypothetical protein M3394_10530, partial [Actinomycetota bacterium]|nr:hypothetical protein [Actinomycetota bacterium]
VPTGSAAGGGRVVDGGAVDDFAFQAKPLRKGATEGDAVHVRRAGGLAVVNASDTLTALARSCSGGKAKTCSAVIDGSSATRWQVDLADGTVTPLAGTSTLRVEATDAAEPDGTGADRYGIAIGAPDGYSLSSLLLSAGNIRIVP